MRLRTGLRRERNHAVKRIGERLNILSPGRLNIDLKGELFVSQN